MVVTNVPLERVSAASLMRIHAQLSGYRGLHFGFAQVGLGELYCTMEGATKSGYIAAEEVLRGRGIRARLAIEARMYDDLAGLVRATVAPRTLP